MGVRATTRGTRGCMASHTPPLPDGLNDAEGCSTSILVISVLLSKRGIPRVIASIRFAIPRVVATLRIEMRLLSEARSVLEYLQRVSVSISGIFGDAGQQGANDLTVFQEYPC